jgi:hypothetical protein
VNPRTFAKSRLSRIARLLVSAAVLLSMVAIATPAGAIGGTGGIVTTDLTQGINATEVAQALVGPGVSISNVKYTGADVALGTFTGGTQPIGFDQGVILSSGECSNTIGPNTVGNITASNGTAGDDQLAALAAGPGQTPPVTYDASVLEFDFVPTQSTVYFTYVFGSDEYNEFVYTPFNDVFAFWVNGVNAAVVGDGKPVSIDTINNGNPFGTEPNSYPDLYRNNDFQDGTAPYDTEMDGLTKQLVMVASVTPNQSNHIKLAICDVSDDVYDSNVFIKAGSFTTNSPIEVTKAVDFNADGTYNAVESGAKGDSASWKVTIENKGSLAATITATDSLHDYGAPFKLASNETTTITYPTVVTVDTTNTVSVTAVDAAGATFGPITAKAAAKVLPPGVLEISKTVDFDGNGTYNPLESAAQGSTAKWRVVVSNTGGTTITGITVTDSNGHAFGPAFDLAAGTFTTFDYSTADVQKDLTNTATASAAGFSPVASSATAVVIVPPPLGDYGKITGSGHFCAKHGSMPDKPKWSGWVHFGFVASRMPGQSEIKGHATFTSCNGWSFKAHDFTSLEIVDRSTATLMGTGEFNKKCGYSFKLQVAENKPKKNCDDTLRLIIWDASGKVVFDSQIKAPPTAPPGTPIFDGHITIQQPHCMK